MASLCPSFYCSRCKFDHPGECRPTMTELQASIDEAASKVVAGAHRASFPNRPINPSFGLQLRPAVVGSLWIIEKLKKGVWVPDTAPFDYAYKVTRIGNPGETWVQRADGTGVEYLYDDTPFSRAGTTMGWRFTPAP